MRAWFFPWSFFPCRAFRIAKWPAGQQYNFILGSHVKEIFERHIVAGALNDIHVLDGIVFNNRYLNMRTGLFAIGPLFEQYMLKAFLNRIKA